MTQAIPHVSVNYARNGSSKKTNELGMRAMQERAFERRGEQYLLIKSPPASGKSRALMFIPMIPVRRIQESMQDIFLYGLGFYFIATGRKHFLPVTLSV